MKILVVDDHALIRMALVDLLLAVQPAAQVMHAADAAQARQCLAEAPDLDLVLLDLQLPDADGLDLLADWREERPALAVVILSGSRDPATARAALAAGASGFIPKAEPPEVLTQALALVLAGGVYVPSFALQDLAGTRPSSPAAAVPGAPTPASLGLTARQLAVLALLVQGRSNKRIARHLNLAEPTVKNHVTALLRALQVGSRTEAVVAVTGWGWTLTTPAPEA